MSASDSRARLKRALARRGEDIIVRRYYGPAGPNRPKYDAQLRARVTGLGNPALIGAVMQGKFKVVALVDPDAVVPAGMVALSALLPVLTTDKIVLRSNETVIEALDDNTGRLNGELFRLDLQVKG